MYTQLNYILYRFRWFHAPLGVLLVLLQRAPLLRMVCSGADYAVRNSAGDVLRCVVGLAALGAYDSVAGATAFTVISNAGTVTGGPASTFNITGTVGVPINGSGGVTFSVSGAPVIPKSFGVTDDDIGDGYSDTLPPGLNVSPLTGYNSAGAPFYNTNLKLTIVGTPSVAGIYRVRLWAAKAAGLVGSGSELEAGYAIAKFIILESGVAEVAPVITTQPVGATVFPGGVASFTIAADGVPAPAFQWRKNGVDIAGAVGPTFTIANVTANDAGQYSAAATNHAGGVISSIAILTVNPTAIAPAIIVQPQSVSVSAGGSASFSVSASGIPALTYQWRKNGMDITGAINSSYVIAPASLTSAGSYTVVVTNSAGIRTSDAATLTVISHSTGDFDGDGQADILLENVSSGDHGLWIMNGVAPAAWVSLPAIALNWRIAGRGDFNGDGQTDILWENVGSGDRGMWIMNGVTPAAWINLPSIALNWRITGTGDFNGDGQTDILWENVSSGDRGMWIMNGVTPAAWINLPSIALNWRITGTGDFNGDSQTDILWENVSSGDRGMWIMNGVTPAAWINLPSIALNWRIAGTGDFNGDGQTDILWENVGSGDRGMWIMNGVTPAAWINLPALDLQWHLTR